MLVLLMFLFNVQPGELSSLRIWGGKDAGPNQFPYVVSIGIIRNRRKNSTDAFRHFCTGSLIAPAWTLTAGHCVKNRTRSYKIFIRYTTDDKSAHYEVFYMIAHQNMMTITFGRLNTRNDIGILKNEEVKQATYAKLSAVDYTTMLGLEAVSAGYGLVSTSTGWALAQKANKTLQLLEVMFVKCFDRPNRPTIIPAICTTRKCGVQGDVCPGDSGGPVIHKSGVVAIHSAGSRCENVAHMFRKLVAYNVPVTPYFSWILEQMRLGSD